MKRRRIAETAFFWACGLALIFLALTSETLVRIVHGAGLCR